MAMMNLARWLPFPAKYKNPQGTTTSDANTTITIMRFFIMAKTPKSIHLVELPLSLDSGARS